MNKQTKIPAPSKNLFQDIIVRTPELALVENRIRSKLTSTAPLLKEIPEYLLSLGGKRIRPLLLLISAKALGSVDCSQELLDISAGIEIVHMSTLLHDDIIDRSMMRRHHQSPLARFGRINTLLAGDFLLVRAFGLCAGLDSFIVKSTEKACIELTEGEILETPLYLEQHDLESGLLIARKKTASLFELATLSAAHLSKAGEECLSAMAGFGLNLGTAFQILDDVLDVSASEEVFGKPSGTDLREHKPSIVNLLWLQSGSTLAKRLLAKLGPDQSQFVKEALAEIRSSSIIDQARDYALSYTAAAKECLQQAQASSVRATNKQAFEDLFSILDFTVERAM